MELRSTGNPDISNPATMSMLEYLSSKGCEAMATRSILHINRLQEFEEFLEHKSYMIIATSKNPYEVLRAQKDGDTVIVYQKKDAKEHLSTMDKDYHLVREFIKSQRKQSNADRIRNMTDEELADFLFSIYIEKIKDYGFIRHISGRSFEFPFEVLEWLKQPVGE